MIARVNTGKLEAENIPAARQFFSEVYVPKQQTQPGFRGAILLTRDDGNSLAVDIYETEEQLIATEHTGWYQETTNMFADQIKGRVRRNLYSVTFAAGLAPASEPTSGAGEGD